MSELVERVKRGISRGSVSLVGVIGVLCVFFGAFLGVAVHIGFFALVAVGAFGPGLLRELGLLDDLDEFQKEAIVRAGYRSYLVGGVILTAVVIARQWGTLRLGDDLVPASALLALLMVVFAVSYSLNFWDVRRAASRVLAGFGGFWLIFVVVSHATEPFSILIEGMVVAVPFLVGSLLCRRWPRLMGLVIFLVACYATYLFDLYRFSPAEKAFHSLFVGSLLVLPLASLGVALIRYKSPEHNEY